MKTIYTTLSAAILVAVFSQSASATIIDDTYWGSEDHGWGDRIGNHKTNGTTDDALGGYTFEVHNMEVSLTGTILNVQINTNYAGHAGLYGTGYGDLFLSSTWDPEGTELDHYIDDDHTNGTLWTYGFSIDGDRFDSSNVGGNGILYEFAAGSSNADNAIMSDAVTGGTFRNGQEVIVDGGTDVEAGTWAISALDADDFISFSIDLAGTSLLDGSEIALHWGMTCGNDTIEGAYGIPEPAILGLLAIGLIGVGVAKRKKS